MQRILKLNFKFLEGEIMRVIFNPCAQKRKPHFKSLTPAQIAYHTANIDMAEKFKTRVVSGCIKLDEADRTTLTNLYHKLKAAEKAKGEVGVSYLLDKILKLKDLPVPV